MKVVEQIYPGAQWAEPLKGNELSVDCIGSDLQITGLVPTYKVKDSAGDLIHQYEKFPKHLAIGRQRTGTQSPEMRFANADTDEKLIAFVRRFGPVVAKEVKDTRLIPDEELGEPCLPGRLIAQQDMQELRNEQAVFRAALALIMHLDKETHDYVSVQQLMQAIDLKMTEELKHSKLKYDFALVPQLMKIIAQQLGQANHGNLSVRHLMNIIAANIREQIDEPNYVSAQQLMKFVTASIKEHWRQPIYDYFSAQKLIKIIAANIKEWPRQWAREKSMRGFEPAWKLAADSLNRIESLSSAHRDVVLPDELTGRIVICELLNSFPSTVFPNPLEMHNSIKFGIRPLLYSMLRRQFIYPRGFSICPNSECRNFFNIERAGQQFCSPECSRHHRQRVYWQKRGIKLRKKRAARRRRPAN